MIRKVTAAVATLPETASIGRGRWPHLWAPRRYPAETAPIAVSPGRKAATSACRKQSGEAQRRWRATRNNSGTALEFFREAAGGPVGVAQRRGSRTSAHRAARPGAPDNARFRQPDGLGSFIALRAGLGVVAGSLSPSLTGRSLGVPARLRLRFQGRVPYGRGAVTADEAAVPVRASAALGDRLNAVEPTGLEVFGRHAEEQRPAVPEAGAEPVVGFDL